MDMREKVGLLEQLRYLKREVDLLSQRIAEMELAAQGGVGRITGMPRSRGLGDVTGEFAVKILEIQERLERRRWRCMEMLGALYAFIDDIDDSKMRQIMSYRYIDGETWQRIAFLIGESDEQYPRRLHNRFLQNAAINLPQIFDKNDDNSMIN